MFKEDREESAFEWTMLGQIDVGRPNLGFKTDVAVYRLMQFTLRDVLIRQYGVEAADKVFYAAGETAGRHFYENLITKRDSFGDFVAELQEVLKESGHRHPAGRERGFGEPDLHLDGRRGPRLLRPARVRRADLHL